ncbi:hypothetical protein BV898_00636 [Hypsibius exemplaris]|uniref:Uncharacterized protein n=1 Tax=Hypsibius exemplaris TaxID=2072580 RepID=A0A1W0XE29_HYPEX|nr:hypothetical protein BV898_00636 [Hypsibius exemplaris]
MAEFEDEDPQEPLFGFVSEDDAPRPRKKARNEEGCTYEEKMLMLVDDLRTQLQTPVNKQICDIAYGAILGHPDVDPGPRLAQLLWDALETTVGAPERPANVPTTYELPPQDWDRVSEAHLTDKEKDGIALERREMEKYLLNTRPNLRKAPNRYL